MKLPQKLNLAAFIFAAVGAINWGLIGLFNFDLFAAVLGDVNLLDKVVYTLVGLSGLLLLPQFKEMTK